MPENIIGVEIDVKTDGVKKAFDSLNATAIDTGKKLNEQVFTKLVEGANNASLQVQKINTEIKNLKKSIASDTGNIKAVENNNSLSNLNSQLILAKKSTKEAEKSFNDYVNTGEQGVSRLSRLFGSLGQNLTQTFTKIASFTIAFTVINQLQNALTGSVNASLEFEKAFLKVRKVVEGTDQELDGIKKQLLELSTQIPVTFTELSGIAGFGGQLGIGKENLIQFTKIVGELGQVTNISTEESATGLARLSQATKEPIGNVEQLASTLVGLSNKFISNESEILNFSKNIAGVSGTFGVTAQQVLGIANAFTSAGVTAEAGGTAVQKSMLAMNKAVLDGGTGLEGFAKVSGITGSEFVKLWNSNPGEAFSLFAQGLTKSGKNATNIIEDLISKDSRVQRAFLLMASGGDLFKESMDLANVSLSEQNFLQKSLKPVLESNTGKLQEQKDEWSKLGSEIGDNITPALIILNGLALVMGKNLYTLGQVFSLIWSFVSLGFSTLGETIGGILNAINQNFGTFTDNLVIKARNLGHRIYNSINGTDNPLEKEKTIDIKFKYDISKGQYDNLIKKAGVLLGNKNEIQITGGGDEIKKDIIDNNSDTPYIPTGGGGKSKVDKAKQEAEKLKKIRDKQIQDEIDDTKDRAQALDDIDSAIGDKKVRGTIDTESKTIKFLEDSLRRQKELITNSSGDELKIRIETAKKTETQLKESYSRLSTIQKAQDDILKGQTTIIKDYYKEIVDGAKNAKDEISGLKDDLEKLTDATASKDEKLSDRRIELLKDEKDLKKDIKDIETESVGIQNFSSLSIDNSAKDSLFTGDIKGSDIINYQEQLQKLADIQKELQDNTSSLTQTQIDESARKGSLNETQKINEDYKNKEIELLKTLAEKGQNYNTIQEAMDGLKKSINTRTKDYNELIEKQQYLEQTFSKVLVDEIGKRLTTLDQYNAKLRETIELMKQASLGGVDGTTKDSTSGTDTNTSSTTTNHTTININEVSSARETAKQVSYVQQQASKGVTV